MNYLNQNNIENMSKSELLEFLAGFVLSMEQSGETLTDEMIEFVTLHKKIIAELSRQRVYKVSNIDASDISIDGVKEYDAKYYGSLKEAKRELRRRFEEQRRNAFVAAPDEIMELGLNNGVAPSLTQSVVTNKDVPLNAPGRLKFYEVRMLQDNQIVPVQFMLTSIEPAPAKVSRQQRKTQKNNLPAGAALGNGNGNGKGKVISFDAIKRLRSQ